jgi:hypothetical protein
MSNEEGLPLIKSLLDGTDVNNLRVVEIPIRPLIQIAENLYERGTRDSDLLQKYNYDISKLKIIPELCNQLRDKSADFFDVRFDQSKSQKEFLKMREIADDLIYSCLAFFDVAFYGNSELMTKVSQIRAGGSHADSIQDLVDIKKVAENNKELLDKVGFDFSVLDQIPEMASKMANMLAKSTADNSESPVQRVARDKVYTVLRDLLDELVRYGRLATRDNLKIQAQYNISYRPAKRKAKEKKVETVSA